MEAALPFSITDPPRGRSPACLLSLEGRWFRCTVRQDGGMLGVAGAAEGIVGGMSGSPIVANNGSAIGVMCASGGTGEVHTEGVGPRLVGNLPGWLLHQLGCAGADDKLLNIVPRKSLNPLDKF
jgi:hypothetical protein